MSDHDLDEFRRRAEDRSQKTVDLLSNNPIVSFVEGAYSFPHDWWLAIHWALGLQGVYGERMERTCERIGRDVDTVISLGVRANTHVYQLTVVVLDFLFTGATTDCEPIRKALAKIDRGRLALGAANTSSLLLGRAGGGYFSTYAATGGRFGRGVLPKVARAGAPISNIILATIGAVIKLAIHTRGRGNDVVDLWVAILTGKTGPVLTSRQYRELFDAVGKCTLPMDKGDYRSFTEVPTMLASAVAQIKRSPR